MIRSTFALPVLIALATVFGLVVALTGDGMSDTLSWIGLGCPVAAVGWAIARIPRQPRAPLLWAPTPTLVRD